MSDRLRGVEQVGQLDVPTAVHICEDCERCTWNPGPDCGKTDHPHCTVCGHCQYRHEDQDHQPERFEPGGEATT